MIAYRDNDTFDVRADHRKFLIQHFQDTVARMEEKAEYYRRQAEFYRQQVARLDQQLRETKGE